mgnify:CR=1 FL=1
MIEGKVEVLDAPRIIAAPPRPIYIKGGRVDIGPDSTGQLRGWVQDIVAEEHDFQGSLGGMG